MQHAVRKRLAASVGAVCLVCFYVTAPASAQSDAVPRKVSKSGKADHELPLSGFVRVDDSCAGIGPPRINLDRPPAHGVVCSRPAEVVLKVLVKDTPARCLGRKALGVRVFYRPHDGYTGKDEARFTAQFPKSQMTLDVPGTATQISNDLASEDGHAHPNALYLLSSGGDDITAAPCAPLKRQSKMLLLADSVEKVRVSSQLF